MDYVSLGIPAKIYDWYFHGGTKKTDGRKVFQFMKLEESMAGEDSEPEEMCLELVGTHFYDQKNKIPMKIPEFKRLIAEFRRIPNGFSNQGLMYNLLSAHSGKSSRC
jgi:hypothetical protein